MSGAIAQRANETSKALGGKVSYLWATLAVFARWQTDEVRVSVDDESRSGRMHRRDRRERPLPRRRDDDLPGRRARRRPLRRAPDRRRDEARPRARRCRRSTAARTSRTRRLELLRGAPSPSTPTSRSRSSSTASSRGRRRSASRSCPRALRLRVPAASEARRSFRRGSRAGVRLLRAPRPASRAPRAAPRAARSRGPSSQLVDPLGQLIERGQCLLPPGAR